MRSSNIVKEQIVALKKKLEEVEKAKDQAEKAREEVEKAQEDAQQQGYDIKVVETEEALGAEVSGVCRTYCAQVWDEALNQAGVKASSVLRKTESVYYPQPFVPLLQAAPRQTPLPRWQILRRVAQQGSPPPPLSQQPSKSSRAAGVTGKATEVTMEMAFDATKPLTVPQDPNKDNEAPRMELVLATLPLPAKGDLKGVGQGPLEATVL